ncbi:hypothetical protein SLEP1_g18719 [Rubroshorea leprosula]|uniref:Uncharacterized protein n=1 Tax=Rubroshorea leprosula TaxID=152421 RepID=A0AAV5J7G8_9ROSI|nr:hypothetical protein SLEP1_g18719 [Rubroshorea leprosula]
MQNPQSFLVNFGVLLRNENDFDESPKLEGKLHYFIKPKEEEGKKA